MSEANNNNTTSGDLLARTGLRASAAGIPSSHPDAALLRLAVEIAAARVASDDANRAIPARYRPAHLTHAQAVLLARVAYGKVVLLSALMRDMQPLTDAGCACKLREALAQLEPFHAAPMAKAAMRDALAMLGG